MIINKTIRGFSSVIAFVLLLSLEGFCLSTGNFAFDLTLQYARSHCIMHILFHGKLFECFHQFLQLKYLAVPGLAAEHLCRALNDFLFVGLDFLMRKLGSP